MLHVSAAGFQEDLTGPWEYLPTSTTEVPDQALLKQAWPSMKLPSNWFLHGAKTYPSACKAASPQVDSNTVAMLAPFNDEKGFHHDGTVWFKRSFKAPEKLKGPLLLDLDMVDYYGEVFLNGQSMGKHEGYFQPWSVNLTPALKPGEENDLLIRVTSPNIPVDFSQRFPVGWPKSQNLVKGIFGYHDCRPGATSIRGQEQNTGGILRGLSLREAVGVEAERVWVKTLSASNEQARLSVEVTLQNWLDTPQTGELLISLTSPDGESLLKISKPFEVAAGSSKGVAIPLEVKQPELWWPWDVGEQPLYTLSVKPQFNEAAQQELAQTVTKQIGLREIKLGPNREWLINGKPYFFRGTNYIGTQWLSQADKAWYANDLGLAKAANLNTVRVHAHLARPELYEVADKLGLLIWQDFPLQWGYSDSPAFHASALRQAKDMVELYGSHPSIVVWSMHNEAPHAMWWMEKRDPEQNKALDNALAEQTRQLDPSRLTHRDTGTLNAHEYIGWYNGPLSGWREQWADIPEKKLPWFIEYGAQALPNKALLSHMLSEKALNPKHPADWDEWKFMGLQPERMFDTAGVSRGDSLDEWIANSQRYQSVITKFMTERLRQQKGKPTQGIANFMLVDCWPAITWSVLDYDRVPKAAYMTLKQVMQPLLPSIEYDPVDPMLPIKLWVINDTYTTYPNATLHWQLGTEPPQTKALSIAATSSKEAVTLGTLANQLIETDDKVLTVWITNEKGKLLSKNQLSAYDFWLND